MATVVVAGALANKPRSGGEAWVRLSWLLGFARMGHEVALFEQLPKEAWGTGPGRSYFHDVVSAFGLEGRAALVCGDGPEADGMAWADLLALASRADLLVNISGHLAAEPLMERFGRRAYVDIDPGWTQIWSEQGGDPARLAGHDVYFTIAESIGRPGCDLPTGGLDWKATRQPVVLDEWPVVPATGLWRFTTIATWRTPFGRLEHAGRTFGMKLDEFRKLIELPGRSSASFELALDIHPAERPDIEALRRHGWSLVDAPELVATPAAFRSYVQGSGAEFSVAQGVYVETGSGWFSDRTARYLSSGRPALVQDTGFSSNLPCGEGLVPFRTLDEAVAGAEDIASDPERHGRAARRIAEEHFASEVVLRAFLRDAGLPALAA
jgi:hypothetical protein